MFPPTTLINSSGNLGVKMTDAYIKAKGDVQEIGIYGFMHKSWLD